MALMACCRRSFWLVLGFTLGITWIQTVRYGVSLSYNPADRPHRDMAYTSDTFPPFEGKIYNLDGVWEFVNNKPAVKSEVSSAQNRTIVDPTEANWLHSQKQRREDIRAYCDTHSQLRVSVHNLKKWELSQFKKTVLVGAKQRALYCPVGKVACTSWKTAMAMLQGHYDGLRPGEHIHDANVLARNDVKPIGLVENPENLLKTYPIFLFVRHPFERLVSAFKNKFHAPNKENLQMKYGRDIIKRYRVGTVPEEELHTGWGVKLPEFIKWILDDDVRNVHWDSFNDLCHLCSIPYTFIGKMETFREDTKYILKHLFGTENFEKFPHSNPSPKSSRVPLQTHFEELSQSDIERLKERYDIDFKMFGYTWPL